MGLDSLSPVAPARVRCLLLPYGQISRPRFQSFVDRLRPEITIRLGDISPNGGSDRNLFSPLAFPEGLVVYDLTTSATTPSQQSLVPFELYRKTLVVIAIADGQEYKTSLKSSEDGGNGGIYELGGLEDYESRLKDDHPTAFVHQLFVFDCDISGDKCGQGIVPIPTAPKLKPTTIKTIMCDVTSLLLSEMTTFARSVQALPNLEIPKAQKPDSIGRNGPSRENSRPGSRASTADSRAQSPTQDLDKHAHRASLPAHLMTSKLGGEQSRPRSAVEGTKTPPITFDQMNEVGERPSTTSGAETTPRARDRVSVQGFGPSSVGERARNQAKSRIGIVMGSMHLLAGRWLEASKELAESASAAKANSDYAWHAKALDYLLVTTLMYAWAGLDFEVPQVLYPFGDNSALKFSKVKSATTDHDDQSTAQVSARAASLQQLCTVLPDIANNILHLYSRAAQFSSTPIPQTIFSDTTIRLAKLLAILHNSSGNFTDDVLQNIVLDKSIPKDIFTAGQASGPSKADVSAILYRAFPSPALEEYVDIADKLRILSGIAAVLSSLGLHRKKAFILREFLATLLPALIQSRKQTAAEQGLHPAASLSTLDMAVNEMGVSGILGSPDGMDHGIQQFLILVCQVYGVIIGETNPKLEPSMRKAAPEADGDYEDTGTISERALSHAVKRAFGNPILKMDVLRQCINICEALPDLRGVLTFSSDLLSTAGSGISPGPGTTDSSPSIPIEDQIRLSSNISRTINAAAQLGFDNLQANYWDEFFLRDVEVVPHNASNVPTARRKAELNLASTVVDKKEGPFIYNPFAKPGSALKDSILIANENVTFAILLQNLYDFDLEIDWIRFDVDSKLFDAQTSNVVIGAYRTQHVHVTGIAKTHGQLRVDAVIAKIRGCHARRFPLFRKPWRMKEDVKAKRHGLEAAAVPKDRPLSVASDVGGSKKANLALPVATTFDAKIIKSQPTVVLKSTTLPQSAIMVLEGERKRFKVTLQNVSDTDADLLLPSFTDSSTEALQKRIENHDITPAELYEAEIDAYQKPAIMILAHDSGSDLTIRSHGLLTLDVEIFGKVGLTYATLQVEYGHLGVPRSEIEERFYTRQLSVPISVTVSPSVGLVHNDILPFTGNFAWANLHNRKPLSHEINHGMIDNQDPSQCFQNLLQHLGTGGHGEAHCLLVLDFMNSSPRPIDISLEVKPSISRDESVKADVPDAYSMKESLQPGVITRMIVLIPRVSVANPYASIPSVRKRQFVVSSSKISPDFERLSREMFWYREEALKYIRATWSEKKSGRSGDVDLRRLTITPRMFETLRLDEVGIEMSVLACGPDVEFPDSQVQQLSRTHFKVPTSRFYNLSTTLTSRLTQPIYPLLRIQPALRHQSYNVALDLTKKVAFNGVLQRPLSVLNPSETRRVDLGLVFLAGGEYEFGACVEEVRVWREKKVTDARKGRPRAATGEMRAEDLIRTDRRTWFAREACLIDVE